MVPLSFSKFYGMAGSMVSKNFHTILIMIIALVGQDITIWNKVLQESDVAYIFFFFFFFFFFREREGGMIIWVDASILLCLFFVQLDCNSKLFCHSILKTLNSFNTLSLCFSFIDWAKNIKFEDVMVFLPTNSLIYFLNEIHLMCFFWREHLILIFSHTICGKHNDKGHHHWFCNLEWKTFGGKRWRKILSKERNVLLLWKSREFEFCAAFLYLRCHG